ncbi:MAG: molybdenum cofactor guanylyltransferase [Spongiibacter sp.]|uniref:molybdenum cofactor guanylyltransferase n=1 Tax=Spongiibacter sp. TaxID=2024860 RepID=UPI000C0A3CEF|nr:molybdenum cofactor guanylyltransferase [Spongiibacter sp.]MAK42963.1 molybdenum cofactor guanylyltransferase [Spongiibacter sp.]|tara:strand:+ start:1558 stop:2145 length:588 start_codon:yes stop_codon:yes gene_type:complete
MTDSNTCIGIVLAGGLSSRMGSDKALLERDGQSQLQHSIDLLTAAGCDRVIVSRNAPGYIEDQYSNAGPLAGIHAAIATEPDALRYLIIPVDMPKLPVEALQQLLQQEAHCTLEQGPLPCVINNQSDLTRMLADNIEAGELRIRRWLKQLNAESLSIEDADWLTNTNTPAEWQRATQSLHSQPSPQGGSHGTPCR